MIKPIHFDDSSLIWLDFNDTTPNELNEFICSNFDVSNIPFNSSIDWDKECPNYFVTFFKVDKRSSTGYAAMFINKNKTLYKSKIGYDKYLTSNKIL